MDWVGAAGQVFRAEFSRPNPDRLFLERLKLNCSRSVGKGTARPVEEFEQEVTEKTEGANKCQILKHVGGTRGQRASRYFVFPLLPLLPPVNSGRGPGWSRGQHMGDTLKPTHGLHFWFFIRALPVLIKCRSHGSGIP